MVSASVRNSERRLDRMTARLDISHHAVERYISRVNKWATREQAMQAIREAWRGARRLHRHTSDRALYEANGGAFRMSVAERPHGRMAILSILPSHEGQEDSTIDENGEIGPPEPPHNPLRKRVIDVQDSGAWKFKPKRKDAPQPARQPARLHSTATKDTDCAAQVRVQASAVVRGGSRASCSSRSSQGRASAGDRRSCR